MREQEIYIEAMNRHEPADRRRFLDEACGDNRALRERLDVLIRHSEEVASFLELPPAEHFAAPTLDQSLPERPGTQIGPYKLLQEIGQGGMGVVYMAEQHEPVRRKVALKIIKPGMDSRQVIARFEAERQALSLMDHPNIARVLDAGTTDTGRPYFVMELVNGIPVTQFCDEQHLTARKRLELFIPICQAVQHAHQKGIIHRDLKPGNILVALYDGRPVPKVIDFGVAKATGGQLTEKTMFTGVGQIVGTLEYMSPEQAQRNQLDIDTRSDVYSLGVVLYELLTGDTPFDKQRLRSTALDELLRIIREEEPPKPSTKLSRSDTLPSVAANRKIEPAKLSALVRGELDWIVMKALEKDRNRRYETANGFAMDIQRYLNDEAVLACPPSPGYRFRKFAKKNKTLLTTTALVSTALVLGLIGTTWQAIRATRAEQLAIANEQRAIENKSQAIAERDEKEIARREAIVSAEREAEQRRNAEAAAESERQAKIAERLAKEAESAQRQAAEAAGKKAVEEAAVAKAVTDFLQQDLLGLATVEAQLEVRMEPDPNLKLATLLDRALANVDERFAEQPRVRAKVQATLAVAFGSIGRFAESARLWGQVRHYCEAAYGPEHPDTLAAMENLAQMYQSLAKYTDAESLHTECLEIRRRVLGTEHPDTCWSMNTLATSYFAQAKYDEAEPLWTRCLEILRREVGPEHPRTLTSMSNLAVLYKAQAKYAEAEPLDTECLEIRRRALGPEHPSTLRSMHNLAGLYLQQGKYLEAERLYTQVLEIRRRVLGPEHPDTLSTMSGLVNLYCAVDKDVQAEPLSFQVLELRRRVLGPEHEDTLRSMNALAALCWRRKNLDQSIPLLEEALRLSTKVAGVGDLDTLRIEANLGVNYKDAGRVTEALPLLEEVYRACRNYPALSWVTEPLADAYQKAGKLPEAAHVTKQQLEIARAVLPKGSAELAEALARTGWTLLQVQAAADAEIVLRECLALRKQLTPDDWRTCNTQSMLGDALLDQKNYAEAEPLLLVGYEGLKAREAMIPVPGRMRLIEALERLAQLYTDWEKPDQAATWREKLDEQRKNLQLLETTSSGNTGNEPATTPEK